MSTIPKAVLYYSPVSVWSAVVLLTLEEKGYADDEVDRRAVDLGKGENYDPSFLRLNPKATVPTLVVPLQKTLSEDVDSRYKAITDTKTIVEFLDRSRSARSRTQTTSSAPAPALAPVTIAFSATSALIIDGILHSESADPNNLRYLNARDEASLKTLAQEVVPSLTGKHQSLVQHLSDAETGKIHVSEKVKGLWREKKAATEALLEVLVNGNKSDAELDAGARTKRAEFIRIAQHAWEVSLKDALINLTKEIIGPYALGDQFSIADLHLAGWLTRVVRLAGGTLEDNGKTAVEKLEARIGSGFALSKDFQGSDGLRKETGEVFQSKLAVFWDAARTRPSWKKVYANGLY